MGEIFLLVTTNWCDATSSIKTIMDIGSDIYRLLIVAIPVIIIIINAVRFLLAFIKTDNADEETKKAQTSLFKSLLGFVVVLLVNVFIVAVIDVVDSAGSANNSASITGCINWIITGAPTPTTTSN